MKSGRASEITASKICGWAIFIMFILPSGITQLTDESFIVEPTPSLRLGDEDFTTILLVNNDNRTETHGRFLNVRPDIGLLTSTARTFIQEGITTEYATQVLGTTLKNGRLYAQLLKKSSRVLYDRENSISPSLAGVVHTSIVGEGQHHGVFVQSKSLLQAHNYLEADKDWQDIDDRLVSIQHSFVGNTDYVGVVPRHSEENPQVREANGNKKYSSTKEQTRQSTKNKNFKSSTVPAQSFKIKANKVQPAVDLPTFTVKNMFSPSRFSWESSQYENNKRQNLEINFKGTLSEQRSPKLLYHQVMDNRRQLSTITYYGFADFTTIVGDSVIVFSPSTSSDKMSLGYVTSIKGEATLGRQESLHVSNIAITITQDLIEPTFVVSMLSTDSNNLKQSPQDIRTKIPDNTFENMFDASFTDKKDQIDELPKKYLLNSIQITTSERKEDTLNQNYFESDNNPTARPTAFAEILTTFSPPDEKEYIESTTQKHDEVDKLLISSIVNFALAEKTFAPDSHTEKTSRSILSRPSDEEIFQIYSSLALDEAKKKVAKKTKQNEESISVQTTSEITIANSTNDVISSGQSSTHIKKESIQPDIHISGGATTIFIENDPFLEFFSPSKAVTLKATQISKQVSQTDQSKLLKTTESVAGFSTGIIGEKLESEIEATTIDSDSESFTYKPNKNQQEKLLVGAFMPKISEVDENEQIEGCIRTSQIFLTQVRKASTYYTTVLNPSDESKDNTLIRIETNIVPSFDISEATRHYCIQPTQIIENAKNAKVPSLERPSTLDENILIDSNNENGDSKITTQMSFVKEKPNGIETIDLGITRGNMIDQNEEYEEEEVEPRKEEEESAEDIEFIYKTLYTTYTYLTTFFHDSTTSVSSRTEIITNIITSSMELESINSSENFEIQPTSAFSISIPFAPSANKEMKKVTPMFVVPSSDLMEIDGILSEDWDEIKNVNNPNESSIGKTYYTTYTYYTTIFVDGETETMSRTEVHTNIFGKSSEQKLVSSTKNLHLDNKVSEEDNVVVEIRPMATYEKIQRTALFLGNNNGEAQQDIFSKQNFSESLQELESFFSSSSSKSEKKVVPIERNSIKMIMDVLSTSNKERKNIENGVFEDQISSESNTDEIFPSATLLLQTSFTTFTYYTTMYSNDITNVISRLETVTNVVTETLQPTKNINLEEASLPITYFTTFTYWTKLAKDGEITTLTREETISNIITVIDSSRTTVIDSSSITSQSILENDLNKTESTNIASASSLIVQIDTTSIIQPTTYYTTYTYYTTSYAEDQTITDSRFETVTSITFPSSVINLKNDIPMNSEKNQEKSAKALNEPLHTNNYDYKTIVDAEGISTLYLRTEVLKTIVDGTPTDILFTTSIINIDAKKALLNTIPSDLSESTRIFKTGLVRLIKGTQLSNETTTVYESKVIGTIIDKRYAQIIESTSSFIIKRTKTPEVNPSYTQNPSTVLSTEFISESSVKNFESSIGNVAEVTEQESNTEASEEENVDDDGNRPSTRLSFQTKKKTSSPVIRPFASRNRPQFVPKRKNILPSSATIITRSDLTPTITATPALKLDSRGRFSSSRKVSSGSSFAPISGSSQGGKRFGRPSKSSQLGGGYGSSSSFPGSSRNRIQSSRNQESLSGVGGFSTLRRSGGLTRGSSTIIRSISSAYSTSSRQIIRSSSSLPFENSSNFADFITTLSPESGVDEDSTPKYESDEEIESKSENSRRNSNPLLRFRRPQVTLSQNQSGQRNKAGNLISLRRSPLTQKRISTTVAAPITTTQRPKLRAFQRPSLIQIQNRSRPQNNLFPSRRAVQSQNVNQNLNEEQQTGEDFSDNENEEIDTLEYINDEREEKIDQQVNRRRREYSSKLSFKTRSKRQVTNFRNRFRRPSKSSSTERVEDQIEDENSTSKSRASSRFTPRAHSVSTSSVSTKPHNNNRMIRPTKPSSNSRAQFTLREKDTTSKHKSRPSASFRRPMLNGVSSRRTTTASSRSKAPRLKNYGNTATEASHTTSPRGKTLTSRARSIARGKSRNDFTSEPITPTFDGTITVTHTSPTEITIPVVNGKVTEYKNILTTTTSIEVLAPNQYTSILGQLGSSTLVLNREDTSINANGATELTQYFLHKSPTSTIIFTPTTIRGRKTSFAHTIPSTAYQVETTVSTIQPQIAANAPLANILLSQLLLGNIGLQQPNINPLLGIGATQAISQNPANPTTEYKTRSSTYITTVTSGMATIIPLTFHGKEILTTIYDSSSEVITATEYFTDTIISTPTQQVQQVQQVNSLLLPYLLQQQLQGQQTAQSVLPIQNSIPSQLLLSDNLQDLDTNRIPKLSDYNQDVEEYTKGQDELVEALENTQTHSHSFQRSSNRKKNRKPHKQHTGAVPPVETSVITLYVSGRRPGEFSTVLSTVQIGGDSSLYKRQINQAMPLLKSDSPDNDDFFKSDGSDIQEYILPATNDMTLIQRLNNNFLNEETQSLESIVGDVSLWFTKTPAQFEQLSSRKSTAYNGLQRSCCTPLKSSLDMTLFSKETLNFDTEHFLV